MLIFTVVLLDLVIRIVQSKDMIDGQSLVFLMLRMIVASSVSMMWELSNL